MNKDQIISLAMEKLRGIPTDVGKSMEAAFRISPGNDFARRLQMNKEFLKYGGVPYEEQKKFTMDNIKDAIQASHLVGYAAPFRSLMPNPLSLKSGEAAVRLGSGKGWEIMDKVLNR